MSPTLLHPHPHRLLVLLLILSHFPSPTIAQQQSTLTDQLPGNYTFIDVASVLRTDKSNARILDFVCPKTITFATTAIPNSYSLLISADYSANRECRIEPQNTVTPTLNRVLLDTPSATALPSTGPVSLSAVYNAFPLYTGNFSDRALVCPLLQTSSNPTSLVLHDIGYLSTVLNYYRQTNITLGTFFNETDVSYVANVSNSLYVSVSIAPPSSYICTYMKEPDRAALVASVTALLNPDNSPPPSPSPSTSSVPTSVTPTVSPTSFGSPSPSSSPACFPADVTVLRRDGAHVRMADLRPGDVVRDHIGWTRVLLFSHSTPPGKNYQFVQLITASSVTVVSSGHFIPVARRGLLRAQDVVVGDELVVLHKGLFRHMAVRFKNVIEETGLYNPQTTSGSILVRWKGDAVVASTYTDGIPAAVAHAALAPVRALAGAWHNTADELGRRLTRWFVDGNCFWPSVVDGVTRGAAILRGVPTVG